MKLINMSTHFKFKQTALTNTNVSELCLIVLFTMKYPCYVMSG